MALAFAVTAGSLTLPGTAYAKHGDGAAIALGIIGERWLEPPLLLQPRQRTTQRHRFTLSRLRRSILTRRLPLRIMLRCRTMGRDITTADTEESPIAT